MIKDYLGAVSKTLGLIDTAAIPKIVGHLRKVKGWQKCVYVFGNGGSAATAAHFANDLRKACGLNAFCLSEMSSTMLAYMNDISREEMFASMLSGHHNLGGAYIGFSCSGTSENVVRGLVAGSKWGESILFTGNQYNLTLDPQLFAQVIVPHPDIKVQEDVHLVLCHAIVEEFLSAES